MSQMLKFANNEKLSHSQHFNHNLNSNYINRYDLSLKNTSPVCELQSNGSNVEKRDNSFWFNGFAGIDWNRNDLKQSSDGQSMPMSTHFWNNINDCSQLLSKANNGYNLRKDYNNIMQNENKYKTWLESKAMTSTQFSIWNTIESPIVTPIMSPFANSIVTTNESPNESPILSPIVNPIMRPNVLPKSEPLLNGSDETYYFQPRVRRRLPTLTECVFCKNNNEEPEFYKSHILKDPECRILCPVLRAYNCPICWNGGGDKAHTVRYCPLNRPGVLEKLANNTSLVPQKVSDSRGVKNEIQLKIQMKKNGRKRKF